MKVLLECPKLVSKNLDKQMKEIFFLFHLYHGITEPQVMQIFRSFPYLFCCELNKIQRFMGEFKKYKMTNEQIINLVKFNQLTNLIQCSHSGGILGSKVSNFVGLFDYFRLEHKIKANELVEILDHFPQMVLQNKKDLIRKKVEIIQKYSKHSDTYIRNLLRRHPDLFLK